MLCFFFKFEKRNSNFVSHRNLGVKPNIRKAALPDNQYLALRFASSVVDPDPQGSVTFAGSGSVLEGFGSGSILCRF
jgi:hypothetical protein